VDLHLGQDRQQYWGLVAAVLDMYLARHQLTSLQLGTGMQELLMLVALAECLLQVD